MNRTDSISKDVMEVAFAGLLHDIGKVRQRQNPDGIFNVTNLENFCPFRNGRRNYLHAGHTAEFLAQCVDKNVFNERIRKIASEHHLDLTGKDKPASRSVQIADRLSSGMDRENFEKYEEEIEKESLQYQQRDYIRARMVSIFSQLFPAKSADRENYIYKVEKLNYGLRPVNLKETGRDESQQEYKNIWSSFLDDFDRSLSDFRLTNNYLLALSSLMELYFWSVPASSYKNKPELSLFDHCRLTSAIASCLYRKYQEDGEDVLKEGYLSTEKVLLVIQGDFSGIQDFIFDFKGESHKYAAKIIRAKSFYVSLATETAASMICDEFAIPQTCVILNAGGKFTVFAPHLADSRERISKVKNHIDNHFRNMTYGQTRFNIASLPASGEDLEMNKGNSVGRFLSELNIELQKDKYRPVVDNPVFENYLKGFKDNVACDICGSRPSESDSEICRECNKFRQLGEDLVGGGDFIQIQQDKGRYELPGGIRFSLLPEVAATDRSHKCQIYQLDRYDNTSPNFQGYAIKFIANYVPVFEKDEICSEKYHGLSEKVAEEAAGYEGTHKTFSHIGADGREKINEKFRGVSHIAVLKADVDNMGKIFVSGFGDKTNFSKIATLSRMFDFFFTGWLQRVLKADERYRSIYTVFAGGDDIFLIGPWRAVMDIALEINKHFHSYTTYHNDIHLSAGISLARPKLTVRKLVDSGEEALEKSKSIKSDSKNDRSSDKNSITIFNQTVYWSEYEELTGTADRLCELILSDGISVSYIYNLFKLSDMRELQEEYPLNAKWHSLFRYNTVRTCNGEADLFDELIGLSEKIDSYKGKLKIALSRCMYRTRRG